MPILSPEDSKMFGGLVEVELCHGTRGLLFICAECRTLLLESGMDVVEDAKDVHLVVDALSDSVQTALAAHTCLVRETGGSLAVGRDQLAGSGPRSAGLVFGGLIPGRAEILEEQASRVPTRQVVEAFQAIGSAGVTAAEAIREFGKVVGRVTVHPHHTRVCKAATCSKCGLLTDERKLQHMGGEEFCCEECVLELEAEQGSKKGLRVIRF